MKHSSHTEYMAVYLRRCQHSFIIIPVHQNCDKTDCSNYWGISLLSTLCKIVSNILHLRLIPHIDEVIGDHHCGF
jgi:sorting nexin-29